MTRMQILLISWAVGVLVAVSGLLPRPLQITVLDVGQGDAILIVTPHGGRILIDTGPDGRAAVALGDELSSRDRHIDLLVLTHPHDDHTGGLIATLAAWDVERVLMGGSSIAASSWKRQILAMYQAQIPVSFAMEGQRIELDGALLDVRAPKTSLVGAFSTHPNADSLVLQLSSEFAGLALFTGDLERAGEEALVSTGVPLRSALLKVGHHGSTTSTTDAFLAAVRPAYAAISVGAHNLYRHPSPKTVAKLDDAGAVVARTDLSGALRYRCSACTCTPGQSSFDLLPVFTQSNSCGTMNR